MQNNIISRREATLYETQDPSFVQTRYSEFAATHPNIAAVPKLTLKDKAGLVFVVLVLLTLQLLEKLKVIK